MASVVTHTDLAAVASGTFDALIAQIDSFLSGTSDRSLIPSDEVQSFALDLRLLLMAARDQIESG